VPVVFMVYSPLVKGNKGASPSKDSLGLFGSFVLVLLTEGTTKESFIFFSWVTYFLVLGKMFLFRGGVQKKGGGRDLFRFSEEKQKKK